MSEPPSHLPRSGPFPHACAPHFPFLCPPPPPSQPTLPGNYNDAKVLGLPCAYNPFAPPEEILDQFAVAQPASSPPSLSVGAQAGVALGSLFFVAAVAAGVALKLRRRRAQQSRARSTAAAPVVSSPPPAVVVCPSAA